MKRKTKKTRGTMNVPVKGKKEKKVPYILTPCERETVITMDASSDYAEIYTCQRSVITKCEKQGYELVAQDGYSKIFKCPTRCV